MDWPWDQVIAKRKELGQQRITEQVDFFVVLPGTIFAMYEDNGKFHVLPLRDNYADFPQLSVSDQARVYPLEVVLPLLRTHMQRTIEQNKQQGQAPSPPQAEPPVSPPTPITVVYPTLIPSTPTAEPLVGTTSTPVAYPAP